MVKIKVLKKDGLALPRYAHKSDAGFDIKGVSLKKIYRGSEEVDISEYQTTKDNCFYINQGERALIGTNLFMEIPEGYYVEIKPKSGVNLKTGFVCSLGTIDAGYNGEIGLIMTNTTNRTLKVELNTYMAQGLLKKVEVADFEFTESLDKSDRGDGGFGSTGVK